MQLSHTFSLANLNIVDEDTKKSIDQTLDKLNDSPKAAARKGEMLRLQNDIPEVIKYNMAKLAEALEPVKDEMIEKGFGFDISSGYRNPLLNEAVGGKKNSAHTRGLAVDVRFTTREHAKELIQAFIKAGFKRIGLGSTFIHADLDKSLPSPACWLYSSKFKTPKWLQEMEPSIDKQLLTLK